MEFHRCFSEQLSPHMVEVYQSIVKEGRKPKSMNDSITILLAKGEDPKVRAVISAISPQLL